MSEVEVNYASVVFRTNNNKPGKKEEETVYDEVKVQNQSSSHTEDKQGDELRHRLQILACCFGSLCVILLLVIVGILVYTSSLRVQYEKMQADQMYLWAANDNLTELQRSLGSENQNLRRDRDNLTRACAVLERSVTNLTAEVHALTAQNQELETQNQQLEAEKKNLTGKLQEEASHGLNVSRAQWSVDQYCRGTPRLCHSCQDGWRNFEPQCYAVNDYQQENQRKTWEEAQADCRGKISDLVVINNDDEKGKVSELSWVSSTNNGYWIGLRVMNGTWKWVDGTEVTRSFWYQKPVEGHCAISVQTKRWESVSCDRRMRWICEKKGLTL